MSSSQRILIAYYSQTGTTKSVADIIHKVIGGDIFEIRSRTSNIDSYNDLVEAFKRERDQNARPDFLDELTNPDDYDVIILGNPCWGELFPNATFTFLEKYKFENKTILPFDTHMGSGLGSIVNEIKKLCPKAIVKDGLAIRNTRCRNCRTDVEKWLHKNGII